MSDEDRLSNLEAELAKIKERNARVTAEKAWERSPTRIVLICSITYLCAALLMWMLGAKRIWLDALVPTLGFFLSSLSLPLAKEWWIARNGRSVSGAGQITKSDHPIGLDDGKRPSSPPEPDD